jgi:hypothetical protein
VSHQIGVPPDPAFKTNFEAVDWALLVVLLMGVVVFAYIGGQAGSNARRWFGPHGAVIVVVLLSLSAAFAVAMARLLLIPSSDALKTWISHQSALAGTLCSPEQLEAAYNPTYAQLDWYNLLLFFAPGFIGAVGLLILCLRAQPTPATQCKVGWRAVTPSQ